MWRETQAQVSRASWEKRCYKTKVQQKNGECSGLHLAAEGFVVADLFVLPVLSFIMDVMEKVILLAVTMDMTVWLHGE